MQCLEDVFLGEYLGLSGSELIKAVADLGYQLGSARDLQCLLERREVVGADDDCCWLCVAGDDNPVMLALDLVDNF